MAIGKKTDFIIYDEQFFTGMSEVVEQNANSFNAASNGAIQLVPQRLIGDYDKESFTKLISGLVTRRDVTSVAAATDSALTQGENVLVKINRKIGPVANTLDSFRKIGKDMQEMSFILGQQVGQAVAADYLNTATNALVAALGNVATLKYDQTANATKTLNHSALVNGLALFGDASSKVAAFVMHSKPYFDLVQAAISDKIFEVAGVTIYSGTVATFNRPVIVTDSAPLLTVGGPNTYSVLGLTESGVVIKESEDRYITSQEVTGLENLVIRMQGEYAFNLGLKGFTWDVTNGGANPADAAIGTGTNWDKTATDNKSTAGVLIKVQ